MQDNIRETHKHNEDRFKELKKRNLDYHDVKDGIKTGIELAGAINERKRFILNYLNSNEKDWNDYQWQLKNSFSKATDISKLLNLLEGEALNIDAVGKKCRFLISPYFLSLIDPQNLNCPVRKQCIPSLEELDESGSLDPVNENGTSVEEIITRRYPDRLIINITNMCGTFCRHCQRKRLFGEHESNVSKNNILRAIEYIRENSEIRDVLITGGDALLVSDEMIEWILSELRKIKHIEIIRLGTRAPVTLPQRITKKLTDIIKKYHPVYINTQFNHPLEITYESKAACEMLADAGIPLGNQMVLLNGINNDKNIVRKLNQQLLLLRVKPYYIFHPKQVKGTKHFWVSIDEGIDIMDGLRGYTSGMAVPYYVFNGPDGLGKTPILPQYLLNSHKNKAVFRNWEGKIFEVDNP